MKLYENKLCFSLQPTLLDPQAKLYWRKIANVPARIGRTHVVVVGETVCVGGGVTDRDDDHYLVFQYNPARDEWTTLPPCPVSGFGLGQFSGELLTVGGGAPDDPVSNKVHHYKPESQEWEEFLQPMPTARIFLTVISTPSALIACGGAIGYSSGKIVPCTVVEVYAIDSETSHGHWHSVDPLPFPCTFMTSATISNTGYLLGGGTTDNMPTKTIFSASIPSLIQKATRSDSTSSAWKTLRDSPLDWSAAASLGGMLLTVGGMDDQENSPAVHVYSPATSSWIRVESGDLPKVQCACTVVELSENRLLVIGGWDETGKRSDAVFLGSFEYFDAAV